MRMDCRLAIGAHHFRGGILVAQSRPDGYLQRYAVAERQRPPEHLPHHWRTRANEELRVT